MADEDYYDSEDDSIEPLTPGELPPETPLPTPEEIAHWPKDPEQAYGRIDKATGGLLGAWNASRMRENPPLGRHELTRDDLLDMWEKAKILPEPDRTKAIQQITRLSKEFESAAPMLVNILLEAI